MLYIWNALGWPVKGLGYYKQHSQEVNVSPPSSSSLSLLKSWCQSLKESYVQMAQGMVGCSKEGKWATLHLPCLSQTESMFHHALFTSRRGRWGWFPLHAAVHHDLLPFVYKALSSPGTGFLEVCWDKEKAWKDPLWCFQFGGSSPLFPSTCWDLFWVFFNVGILFWKLFWLHFCSQFCYHFICC